MITSKVKYLTSYILLWSISQIDYLLSKDSIKVNINQHPHNKLYYKLVI